MNSGSVSGYVLPSAPARSDDCAPQPLPLSGARAQAAVHIDTIDAARFIAIVGVAFVHAFIIPEASFGVSFYIFAALYFQARSFRRNPDATLGPYMLKRFRRLYLPLLVWSVIYGAVIWSKCYFEHRPLPRFELPWLWTGREFHLWFLPFLLFGSSLTAIGCRITGNLPKLRLGVIVACAVFGAFLAVAPRPQWLNYNNQSAEGFFFLNSWKALPSLFLGLAFSWWLVDRKEELRLPSGSGFIGLLIVATMIADQMVNGYSRLDRTLAGFGLLLAALSPWPAGIVAALAPIGRLSYGMYLSHVLIMGSIMGCAKRLHIGPSMQLNTLTWITTIAVAYLLAKALSRSKWLAFLNG